MSFGDLAVEILCHIFILLNVILTSWPCVILIIVTLLVRDVLNILNAKLDEKEMKIRQMLSFRRRRKG